MKKTGRWAVVLLICMLAATGCGKADRASSGEERQTGGEGNTQPKAMEPLNSPEPTGEPDLTGEKETGEAGGSEQKGWKDLNQQEITKAMGAGWNLGNQLEATTNRLPGETKWGNPVITEELLLAVKEAGFQSVRIPVSYLDYIGSAPDYTVDSKWLDRVEQVVEYCVENGMYAIINMHGDGYYTVDGGWLLCGEKAQEEIRAKYEACWRQIAERFRNYDEHLIFESMNEVFDGSYNEPAAERYANINEYNRIFVDTVRKTGGNNGRRWLLIPGWNTDIEYTAGDYGFIIPEDTFRAADLPKDEKRLMISVHYYAPWDFCGGESGEITQWGDSAENSSKTSVHSGQGVLAAQMKRLKEVFTAQGYPVVIGEYGSIDKTEFDEKNNYYRAYFARKVCENSLQNGCIPVYWDNGYNGRYGFALFDRRTVQVTQPEIIAAIMQVYQEASGSGTAQGIELEPQERMLCVGDEPCLLTAKTVPEGCEDPILWRSSDESIVTVSDSGTLCAQTTGEATVYAFTPNGKEASCKITVKESEDLRLRLYAVETVSWSTISSDTESRIGAEGGTYTLTMSGSKELLSNIGTLYLKDVQVQSGSAEKSKLKSVKITIDSVRLNGTDCKLTGGTKEEGINGQSKVFDYCLLNQWAKGSEKIKDVEIGENGSYRFTEIPYQEKNTIEVTFTVTEVVLP